MIKKKLVTLSMIVLLVMSLFPFSNFTAHEHEVSASETIKKRVLEIVDNGDSKLAAVLPQNQFEIKSMRMKSFVAEREELDGKYDLIYIGEGVYSPSQVGTYTDRSLAHNTLNKQNDITTLKANEITNDFILKNQLVIIHKSSLNSSDSKLKSHFQKYVSTEPRNNVKFVNGVNEVSNVITAFYNNNNSRPRLELTQKPDSYPGNKEYQAYEKISFHFNVSKQSSNGLIANLYIDGNFNHRFEEIELVQSTNITGTTGTLEYKLPKGYSGLRYWKVEIVERNSRLKDYATGVFKFKGEKVNIKVLQVTSGSNDGSRLTLSNNMNQSYLSTEDYNIEIDTVGMLNFTDSQHQYSHTKLNGNYDMLIFGFNDSYNANATLTTNAAASVQAFIQTGQSVMFTHDTIFNQNNIWVNNFMNATGQKNPWTNLGFGAPQQSENTKKVNEGLLTQFPFVLGPNIKIKNTHNQYYTLDLEDPTVIPWYNIIGGHRDNDDSWNHYYTYSKGSITYSGTGHTNNSFPIEEQKLFVNTMFRAFLGANTAPFINVLSPSDGRNHLKSQDLELVYEAYDLDLTDRQLKTRVYINGSQQPIFIKNDVSSGAVLRYNIDSNLLTAGTTKIKIEVEDPSGAITFIERTINVQEAELNISKSISKTKAVIDEQVTVKYSISVDNISGSNSGLIFPYAVVEDALMKFTEIPVADESSTGNYGWIESVLGKGAKDLRTSILNEDYFEVSVNDKVGTEPGNMNMVTHVKTWLNGQEKEVLLPIVDEYPNGRKDVVVKQIGIFKMYQKGNGVFLRYEGSLSDKASILLSNIKIEDFIPDGIEIVINDQNANVQQEAIAGGKKITISFDNRSLKQLYENRLEFQYTIKGTQAGIYIMDQSSFTYKIGSNNLTIPFNPITLEVVQPVTGVKIQESNQDLVIGEAPQRLFFNIIPEDATNKEEAINSAVWSSSDPSIVSIDSNGYITAHKKGNAVITITINDVDQVNGGQPFTDHIEIASISPLDAITIEGESEIFVGDEQQYSIITTPPGVELNEAIWSIIQGNELIELKQNGQVKAINPGSAIIKVEVTYKGQTFSSTKTIEVKQFKINPEETDVNIGETKALQALIYRSATVSNPAFNVVWSSNNNGVATVSNSGNITGISKGTAKIKAKITINGIDRFAEANVTVKEIELTGISAPPTIYVQKGASKNIQLEFTPSNATNKAVTFTVDRDSYVSVDSNGNITGKNVRYGHNAEGKLTIVPAATVTVKSIAKPSILTKIDIVVVEEGQNDNGPGSDPSNGSGNGSGISGDRW